MGCPPLADGVIQLKKNPTEENRKQVLFFSWIPLDLIMYQMTFFRFLYDRVCHRMREMFFQAGCDTKQFFLLHAVERYYIGYNRFCLGQGSGLVKYDRLRLGNGFLELAALDRNVMLACLTHRRQDCKRHCQLQCAGEINHQDRQCFRRVAGQQIGQRGSTKCIWY